MDWTCREPTACQVILSPRSVLSAGVERVFQKEVAVEEQVKELKGEDLKDCSHVDAGNTKGWDKRTVGESSSGAGVKVF